MTEEEESDMLYFFLYFLGSCFGLCFVILFLFFCFSGRICIFIYYKVSRTSYPAKDPENTPLIVESEYFPRPGYDGYCLLGQEGPPPSVGCRGGAEWLPLGALEVVDCRVPVAAGHWDRGGLLPIARRNARHHCWVWVGDD